MNDLLVEAREVAAMLRAPTSAGFQYREKDKGADVIDRLVKEIEELRSWKTDNSRALYIEALS
jgi:hypothetical protein